MWKDFLESLGIECEFTSPAVASDLDKAASKLGVAIPEDLRELLRESNGVIGEYGLGLIWPLEKIVEDNLRFRGDPSFHAIYMPFNSLLFFADAGNGDQFAFPIHADGAVHRPDVFAWNHEDDSRNWVAPSLRTYLEW
jgi:hypothetical protein